MHITYSQKMQRYPCTFKHLDTNMQHGTQKQLTQESSILFIVY